VKYFRKDIIKVQVVGSLYINKKVIPNFLSSQTVKSEFHATIIKDLFLNKLCSRFRLERELKKRKIRFFHTLIT